MPDLNSDDDNMSIDKPRMSFNPNREPETNLNTEKEEVEVVSFKKMKTKVVPRQVSISAKEEKEGENNSSQYNTERSNKQLLDGDVDFEAKPRMTT
jgi:hypothetical protein